MAETNSFFPTEVILEVTNACNLRCRYCHFHSPQAVRKRKTGFMSKAVWERVLQELYERQKPVSLMTHGAGEPLLHPDLWDILHHARRIPQLSLGFMTNGMLLDQSWASKLVDLQLDFIALSIDGIEPATHDYFRRNADLKLIEQNVFTLIQEKERKNSSLPELNFNMVCYPEIEAQSVEYVKKWLPYASGVNISRFRPVGSRKLWRDSAQMKFRPCPLLYRQIVIGIDGRVGLCCEDINLEVQLGSVLDSEIGHIFNNSPVLQNYRKGHENQDISSLYLCTDCHVWAGDVPIETSQVTIQGIQAQQQITHAFQSFQRI